LQAGLRDESSFRPLRWEAVALDGPSVRECQSVQSPRTTRSKESLDKSTRVSYASSNQASGRGSRALACGMNFRSAATGRGQVGKICRVNDDYAGFFHHGLVKAFLLPTDGRNTGRTHSAGRYKLH
jgi:hypothetical protein